MWWEVPKHLEIKNHELIVGGISANSVAKKYGTPLYVYNGSRIKEVYNKFYNSLKSNTKKEIRLHYAMKTNSNKKILELLKKEGSWIDAVSPEEAQLALDIGFPKEKILFTGTAVSNEDPKKLVKMGIRINIDSISELKRLAKISTKIEISFRMDPGISGAGVHWKTMTAGKESHGMPIKFSIPENEILDAVKAAKNLGFKIVGLHEHIGSGWRSDEEVNEFLQTVDIVLEKAKEIEKMGIKLEFISFGGGPGIRYQEGHKEFPLEKYAKGVTSKVDKSGINVKSIAFEPGRYIVGDSGLLLVEVVDVKERYGDIIAGVNSGFGHLVRPTMYSAYHEIINCSKADKKNEVKAMIAGNLCETGDVFTPEPRLMPKSTEGDILAIHNAGAYGYSMASHYNLRTLPKEIMILDGKVLG